MSFSNIMYLNINNWARRIIPLAENPLELSYLKYSLLQESQIIQRSHEIYNLHESDVISPRNIKKNLRNQ